MGNRTAKFLSALVGSIIAGAPLAAVSQNASTPPSTANAANDCLGSPKGAAPQGQHWHYRLERATKRQCWYLRAEGGKPTQTAQATLDTPAADSAVPQQHSVQDARAEYLTPQSIATVKTPAQAGPAPTQQAASPSADVNAQQAAVAGRWPDATTASAAPTEQPSPAPVAAAAQPTTTKPAKSPAPMALAAADSTADKQTGSLQMLLLVIGGALALAGILASVVYRFAGGRVHAGDQRRVNWDNFEPHDHDDGRAPWLKAAPAGTPHARQPRPVDFDALRPQTVQLKTAQLAAIDREIDVIDERTPQAHQDAAELDDADVFNGEFQIEAAPQLAANDVDDEEPADRDDDAGVEDGIDIDVITTMLERLAKDGPRLTQPNLEADLADFARSPRGQSAARA
ncbi:hypothetical protein ABIB85_004958 [Bradyrhizobium sp. JR1.5]|uniref:hypothetical protein n=1 Tax=unclassified Bradyrhizobium TaxID=2631580 RepID=UPI0033912C30